MRNKQDIVSGSKGVYKENLRQNITLYLLAFYALFLCFWGSKNICSFLFCASNNIKICSIWFWNEGKLDRVPFGVYPSCNPIATQIVVL